MAVLIAIEIFVNIVSYLRDDVIHVRIVLATALMAIARKVIILDYSTTGPQYIYATAAVVAAMALAYWLVCAYSAGGRRGQVVSEAPGPLTTREPAVRRAVSVLAARDGLGACCFGGLIVVLQLLLHLAAHPAALAEVLDDQRDDGDEVELAEDGLEHGRHASDARRRR